ncbi:MAG: NAD-dependent epimerase/dehydratase family protein [Myxococcales bacterium]|nr:NAD-dependent epimerase/dehydratase family protein [Myxococcales bacterium]
MHWLVTGGAGFCGRAIVSGLLQAGERVRVFDIAPCSIAGAQAVQGDVRDFAAVHRAMADTRWVIHAAAAVPLARNRQLFASVNVEGTRNVLRAAADHAVAKVVVVSSSAVYGAPAELPVTMTSEAQPLEAYGRSKLAADQLAHLYADAGLPVAVVRPRTVLGPGRLGLFSLLFDWVRRGRPVVVVGDGAAVYQFVHADDLARLCVAAAHCPHAGPFLAGSARPIALRSLLRGLCDHAGTGSRLLHLPDFGVRTALRMAAALPLGVVAPYHARLYGRPLSFDITQTCAQLVWQPVHSDGEALRQSYDWFVQHGSDHGDSVHTRPLASGWLGFW